MTARKKALFLSLLLLASVMACRGEAMLEIFQMSWSDLIQKMPEIAEAGYTSLWLPPPTKGGSVFSVGYDVFDPFDLGDKNQRGTIATRYGTKAQLLQLVQVAHQFGLRVYFDDIMNHRGFDTPGYDANTPTNIYPGLLPQDFHLQTIAGGFYRDWPSVQDYNNQWDVQYESLGGLIDLANEPGSINGNFGPTLASTAPKLSFVRHPNNPEYYLNPAGPSLGGPWHPFYTTNGTAVADDVNSYLIRAAMWILNTTKCDGFRLDAVKHVPSPVFGASSTNSQTDDPTFSGYTGGIQAIYDYVHGYGSNVLGNGYMETDGNRNSVFDTEAPRNDAMLFGEHLGPPPSFQEYLNNGMRLFNVPLRSQLDSALQGHASLSGFDQRDYAPSGGFSPAQAVQFAQDQDSALCCVTHREMHNAYYFMREGLPMIYSDNYNFAGPPSSSSTFPIVPFANYLGEFNDNGMPELVYLHHQLARGGTRPRWSDQNIVAFERYDYRDVNISTAYTNSDATVMLFAMNDNYGFPGDVLFDDGVSRTADGYYTCANGSPSRGIGLVVGFPPGSVLSQMATTSPGGGNGRTCAKLLVHGATSSLAQAQATTNAANPADRLIYVGSQSLAPGGGAVEMLIPSGGWVMYGYHWPEASRASLKDAVSFRQGGSDVPRALVYRHDGTNGDPNFNPLYPFKMRGSIDPNGNVLLAPGEGNVPSRTNTYAILIPVLTNAPFDIAIRCDASASNALVKLDGGLDLNSQMGLGPTGGLDLRDNRPGYATDVFLGYEQSGFQFRCGPEKFAARVIARDNVTSLGAETYYYTVSGGLTVINGSGNGANIKTSTANWTFHDPVAPVTVLTNATVPVAPATQMVPTNPAPSQPVDIWVKVGYQFQTDTCYLYYTTDGTNPEGSFGLPKPGTTTKVQQAFWVNHDSGDTTIDWWRGTIPGTNQISGAQIRYKAALFLHNPPPISDADASKLYGLTQSGITNFNPATATVWLHNDLNTNSTSTGLAAGFHIVRARCFLPRAGKSGTYNTFLQTFYYDGQLPTGAIAFPPTDGSTIASSTYQVVVRADSSVIGVDFNIQDSDPNNDDAATGQSNGNGLTNGVPVFVSATQVSPDPTLNTQYPNAPQEFRFTYVAVPSSGTATITVRLKTLSSSVYTNRITTLTRTVNTQAPGNVLYFSNPASDGSVLLLASNATYLVQACFTPTLTTNDASLFSLYINGALQPRGGYAFQPPGAVAGCPGLRSFLYNWTTFQPGTNLLQLNFTNQLTLSASRSVEVGILYSSLDSDGDGMPDWMELIAGTNPYDSNSVLRITGLQNGNQLAWQSVSNIRYQVLATTNLLFPLFPVSTVLQAVDSTTFWSDAALDPTNKFYRVQVVH
jgi:hypothetical protein